MTLEPTTTAAAGAPARALFGRSLLAFAATAAGAAALALLAQGEVRTGAVVGVVAAIVASTVAIGFLELTWRRSHKHVLGGIVGGFLLRLLLVVGGLLTARALGGELLAYVAAFFGLYLTHQTIEIAVLMKRARPAEGQA